MVGGICIIFFLGIIPYSLSAPDPLDAVNININLDEGTNKGYASDYVGDFYRYRKKYSRKYGSRKYGRKYGSRKKGRNMVTEKKATSGITKRGATSIAGQQREQFSETNCKIPTPSIAPESMTIQDGDRIYAGFYKPSSMQSGYIKFNICKKGSTCSHPGGELTMFGGSSDTIGPPEKLVTKVQVQENVKKAGITKIDDLKFNITSVEDLDGNKIEGEVAAPILVFRPKIGTHELHTIFFNILIIQPPAIEMTEGVKIRIESDHEKIFHVNNEDDYESCDEKKYFCMAPNLYMDKEFIRGNGNNHNGSYLFFDRDGLPEQCLCDFCDSSRGNKVQIIIDPKNNP